MAKTDDTPRRLAFDVLLQFERTGSERLKADSLIQDALNGSAKPITEQDRGFTYALVMGTLRHWQRLDQWILAVTQRKLKQFTPQVRVLLRLGLFQLYGLSQVPGYAAINTTVNLAKGLKQSPKTIGFLNAVLREAQRRLENGGFPIPAAEENLSQHLLCIYGWSEGLTEVLQRQFSADELLQMAQAAEHRSSHLSIRVNTLKTTPEAYQTLLIEAGWQSEQPNPELPENISVHNFSSSPRQLPGYEDGLFYVQDPASLWVSHLLDPQPGERILDLCAAPGSKTTHMAALMHNEGEIIALEPKPERLSLLQENLTRLGVEIVNTELTDALPWPTPDKLFDHVLVDAPCSGSGTLRKHPEILLHLRKMDLTHFTRQQMALLRKGFECLKPGGTLVYSTCSFLPAENTDLVKQFLKATPNAQLLSEEQRLLSENADGFYAVRILKVV